ncbi:MAG: LysM peptidoglycan-binding domain-containing protein [Pedobacter sp.]
MARLVLVLLTLLILAGGCVAPPLQELQSARTALDEALAAEAAVLAPNEYQAALDAMRDGEALVDKKKYNLAKEILPFAEAHARRAILQAKREQADRELQKIRAEELLRTAQLPNEPVRQPTQQTLKAITTQPVVPVKPKPRPVLNVYRVGAGETLWTIAAQQGIYGDPLLWPLIYQANRDQIRDPRQVYPGQSLSIPRKLSEQDKSIAREKALKSRIFPVRSEPHSGESSPPGTTGSRSDPPT